MIKYQSQQDKYHSLGISCLLLCENRKGGSERTGATNQVGRRRGEKKGEVIEKFGTCTYCCVFKMDNQQDANVQHRKLFNVTWQPGWEGSWGENGYMYRYG